VLRPVVNLTAGNKPTPRTGGNRASRLAMYGMFFPSTNARYPRLAAGGSGWLTGDCAGHSSSPEPRQTASRAPWASGSALPGRRGSAAATLVWRPATWV